MKHIINMTQHQATQEQLDNGVIELDADLKSQLIKLLTVEDISEVIHYRNLEVRANQIIALATEQIARMADAQGESLAPVFKAARALDKFTLTPTHLNSYYGVAVMLGGAPWMMPALEKVAHLRGLSVCYAFSKRVSEEQHQPDGSVKKVNTFKHQGFIWA